MTRIVYIESKEYSGPADHRNPVQTEDTRFNAYDRHRRQDHGREETQFRSVDRLMRTTPGFSR